MSKPLTYYGAAAAFAALVSVAAPADAQIGGWQTRNFPPPNGGFLVYRIVGDNPECASYNGRDCLWGQAMNQIRFNEVHPLMCGADHRAKWGITGYDNPRHWCSLAKPIRFDDSQ